MSTLTEHADRLSQIGQSIYTSSLSTAGQSNEDSIAGPFTRAILETDLSDLIRDIDPTELGLFTIVQPTQPAPSHTQEDASTTTGAEIARVEFPGATPLRRPPARRARDDPARPREHEPEVYAQAALKYLERYSSIRPMPRASEQAERIIEQLSAVRDNIFQLSETLKQANVTESSTPPPSPGSAIQAEEDRIQEIRADMMELKKKKEALLKRKTGIRTASKIQHSKAKPKPPPPMSPDVQEESFWNTPAANARTLHFNDDLLTDETLDLANSSAFASPIPESKSHAYPPRAGSRTVASGRHLSFAQTVDGEPPYDDTKGNSDNSGNDVPLLEQLEAARDPSPDHSSSGLDEEDATIRLGPVTQISPQLADAFTPATPDVPKKARLKVTTELELIVTKIWSTIGDIIMPGNPFDVNGLTGSKPPHAKETIAHLRSTMAQTPIPGSPTASLSSLSTAPPPPGQPTAHQVLIAQVLLALLDSPPHYSVPLNQLKTMIAGTEAGKGLIGTALTKPIYNLVAKRCLKIDRGGKEQMVKFAA
ncbi:hypothetical protein QCA50_004465 [Cerrena zonata]|uniref:Uncharacterized protein n=1 Tax=Cerrena zonata TaxID=2478898 RepID=A0AAW0GTY6_9APHY